MRGRRLFWMALSLLMVAADGWGETAKSPLDGDPQSRLVVFEGFYRPS